MNGTAFAPFQASPELAVAAWLITYAIHSTILLGIVWVITSGVRLVRSDLTRDILWKTALVGGIITASLQFSAGIHPLGGRLGLRPAHPAPVATLADAATAHPASGAIVPASSGAPAAQPLSPAISRLVKSGLVRYVSEDEAAAIGIPSPTTASTTSLSPVAIRRPDGRVWFGTRDSAAPLASPDTIAATPAPTTSPESEDTPVVIGTVASNGSGAAGGPSALSSALSALSRLLPFWPMALVATWLAGAAFFLARFAVGYRGVMRRIGERREVGRGLLRDTLRRLAHRAGIERPIALTSSTTLSTPVALGRSEICVPDRAIDDLTGEQQEGMLAHELAHLVRRDPSWLVAAGVLEAIFWFQPLARVARRQMQDNSEYICDDWAVTHTGRGLPLARCLAEVGRWVQSWQTPLPVAAMARRDSALVSRVERLLDASRSRGADGSAVRRTLVAASVVAFVVCLAPIVSADGSDPAAAPKAKKTKTAKSKTTTSSSSTSSSGTSSSGTTGSSTSVYTSSAGPGSGTITIRSSSGDDDGSSFVAVAPAVPGDPSAPAAFVWAPTAPTPPTPGVPSPDPFHGNVTWSRSLVAGAAPAAPPRPGTPAPPSAVTLFAPGAQGGVSGGAYVVAPGGSATPYALYAAPNAGGSGNTIYSYSVPGALFGPANVIGVSLSDVGDALADQLGLDADEGALITNVQDDMPAAKSGLKKHDIITAINGESPVTVETVIETISATDPGDTVEITVLRRGESETFEVEVVERKPGRQNVQAFSTIPGLSPEQIAELYAAGVTPLPDIPALPEIPEMPELPDLGALIQRVPKTADPQALADLERRLVEAQRSYEQAIERQQELLHERLALRPQGGARALEIQQRAEELAAKAREQAERQAARAHDVARRAEEQARRASEYHRELEVLTREAIGDATRRHIVAALEEALEGAELGLSGPAARHMDEALQQIAREINDRLREANIEIRIEDDEGTVEIDSGRRINGGELSARIIDEIVASGRHLDDTVRRAVERTVKAAARDLRTIEFELDDVSRERIQALERRVLTPDDNELLEFELDPDQMDDEEDDEE